MDAHWGKSLYDLNMPQINAPYIPNPQQKPLMHGLYLVPTPIGNLRDITLRALDVLNACDFVVCEDSRVTGKLLKAYQIDKRKIVYNDHASIETRDYIVRLLGEEKIIAMVSDAGTPMISDPGHKLVQACVAAGCYVTALPGANAVLPAVQLSALNSNAFVFAGFLPSKDKALREILVDYKSRRETILFYESANRLEKTLKIIHDMYGDRPMAVVREISKLYEEAIRGTALDILNHMTDNIIKGEIVVVIEGAGDIDGQDFDVDEMIQSALQGGESVKSLSERIAMMTGLKKRDIYNRALQMDKA